MFGPARLAMRHTWQIGSLAVLAMCVNVTAAQAALVKEGAGSPPKAATTAPAQSAPAGPTAQLAPKGDRAGTAGFYGLKPGVNALLVGYYPVRKVLDWSHPPMDAVYDRAELPGCQLWYEDSPARVNLVQAFKDALLPGRIEGPFWYCAYRMDGWLWIEQAGTHHFRLAIVNDGARIAVGGEELIWRPGPAEVLSVDLTAGFHRLRLDGFNTEYGMNLVSEWKRPGDANFAEIPAASVYRGPWLRDDPRLFLVGVAGRAYDYRLSAQGGKGPHRFALAGGGLPKGLSLSADGRISGTPSGGGFSRFLLRVSDANGLTIEEPLGLKVLPSQSIEARNDAEVFELSFDQTDPATLKGGPACGPGRSEGIKIINDYNIIPFHGAVAGQTRKTQVVEGEGPFGSRRHVRITGTKDHGFFLVFERQSQVLSDAFPAFRRANRFSLAFRFPQKATAKVAGKPVPCDWKLDPKSYLVRVILGSDFHMAEFNTARYAGHRMEVMNWHFYHPRSHYWGDHWQASNYYYLGNGWYYLETANQPAAQRSGTGGVRAGLYDPTQDSDFQDYFASISSLYVSVDLGWGATLNTYADHAFEVGPMRVWREGAGVRVRHSEAARVARLAIPPGQDRVEVPFQVTHTYPRPQRFWVSRLGPGMPLWDGKGIYVDANGNGKVDPGEEELGLETPELKPGRAARFVYRIDTSRLKTGQTLPDAVNLRVHDPDDPLDLGGDSMMILIHKADNPAAVPLDSLTVMHALDRAFQDDWRYTADGKVRKNEPPAARIDGPAAVTAKVGQEVAFQGAVSDPDGPQQPAPYWDMGDDTPYQFGPKVTHAYARPGKYTVTLFATDCILLSKAVVTVTVSP